jgi:outer membrane receptor protein involved in Fe transport
MNHQPHRTTPNNRRALCLLFAALGAATHLPAQTAAPATTTTTTTTTTAPAATTSSTTTTDANGEPVTTLEKYTVSDVPISEQVLPTVRPVSSVYGDGMSVIDIPRSVSSVNSAWMSDRGVKDSMDLGQFAPGVYSAANYGVPAVPQIRGDFAQVYMDGQLTPYTFTAVLPTFNGAEAMDIVKGPGTAVYGPQGNGPGGYVNLVMKQPYFDTDHGDLSFTFAGWASGHSYSNPSYTLDFGGPITPKLAYRISYHASYGDGYYEDTKNEDQDIYANLTYLFSNTLKIEYWGEFYDTRFNEVAGANRVTQAFIWNGTYVGGSVNSSYAGIFGLLDPATITISKLPDDVTVENSQDVNRSKRFLSQLTETANLTADSQLINKTFFEVSASHQFEGFGYDEDMPLNQMIQDRLEYHDSFTTFGIPNSLIAGADFRYSRLVSYNDFSLQPFFYFDLTKPLDQVLIPGFSSYLHDTIGSGLQVPGTFGYSGQNGSSGDQDSHIYDAAAFVQDNIQLTKEFSLLLGFRQDSIKADTSSPPFLNANATPSVYQPEGYYYAANVIAEDPSYFASAVYKLTDTASVYLTYDRVDAVLGSGNFGGVNVTSGSGSGDPNHQLDVALKTGSTLYEAGYKQSLLGNKLYFAADVYQQEKSEPQIEGPALLVKTVGLELDAVYQPTVALTINGNFTYQDATAFGGYFYQQTGNYLDGYPTSFVVPGAGGLTGTGLGSPNFTGYEPPTGRIRAPGVPQLLANLFVEYKFPQGFGFGVGPKITGKQYANDQDTLHIPAQYSLDGYVFYKFTKHWDVHVNINNITNQRILDTIDTSFAGNDLIFVSEPVNASVTLHYRF